MAYPLESGEVAAGSFISGWNSTCQPYIESTTVLSDYYCYYYLNKSQETPVFRGH